MLFKYFKRLRYSTVTYFLLHFNSLVLGKNLHPAVTLIHELASRAEVQLKERCTLCIDLGRSGIVLVYEFTCLKNLQLGVLKINYILIISHKDTVFH